MARINLVFLPGTRLRSGKSLLRLFSISYLNSVRRGVLIRRERRPILLRWGCWSTLTSLLASAFNNISHTLLISITLFIIIQKPSYIKSSLPNFRYWTTINWDLLPDGFIGKIKNIIWYRALVLVQIELSNYTELLLISNS